MYEEVCLLCGRPVAVDGRAYCSDNCESQDVTSPSISTTSSAHPSPFLHSTANAPPNLAEVPALLPSALGHSLGARKFHHRVRNSESSSSNSSVSWSVLEDDYDEDTAALAVQSANTDDEYYAMNPEYMTADTASKLSPSFSNGHLHPGSSLAYVRRPSTTNNRSTIPTLHRRTSSVSASTASTGQSHGIQDASVEDDSSDIPSPPPASSSVRSDRRHSGKSADWSTPPNDDGERDQDDTVGKKRRNRASLPAYFSLLVSTSTTPRSQKGSPALSMLSRSLQQSSSPPTPRLANPIVDTTTAFAMAQSARAPKEHHHETADAAPRGRSRRRDPDGRSSSSRRSPSRSPRPRAHVHQSAQVRARLDSMEKVADWVAHSPVVAAGIRAARQLAHRRNSSPPPLPKFEKMHLRDSGVDFDSGHLISPIEQFGEEVKSEDDTRRGRRRADELDQAPFGVDRNAPGYGNGRSGLIARDRERGRPGAVKR